MGTLHRGSRIAFSLSPPTIAANDRGGEGDAKSGLMVTAGLFESVRQPLCVLLAVPVALIGVFLTFFYVNATFTREAYIGVIMMGGSW
jgi:hypothetical protein